MDSHFTPGRSLSLLLMFSFVMLAAAATAAAGEVRKESAGEQVVFKRLPSAILKIDGKQVKLWEVYREEKRGHLVLVQLGRRYLLLDTKEREILEIAPGAIENKPKGNEVVWTRTLHFGTGNDRAISVSIRGSSIVVAGTITVGGGTTDVHVRAYAK